MRVQNDTSSVGNTVRVMTREYPVGKRAAIHHHRHDIGEDIAALDEHWVFRKAR